MNLNQLAWLECRSTGCHSGMAVDSRHVDNLTATGGWECHQHQSEVPC